MTEQETLKMLDSRPYLFEAGLKWVIDSGGTPFVLVNAAVAGTQVPAPYVKDGRIVLNLSMSAIRDYHANAEGVRFSSRFNGQAFQIVLPWDSVVSIYCKENAQGLAISVFKSPEAETEDAEAEGTAAASPPQPAAAPPPEPAPAGKPARPSFLRVVK